MTLSGTQDSNNASPAAEPECDRDDNHVIVNGTEALISSRGVPENQQSLHQRCVGSVDDKEKEKENNNNDEKHEKEKENDGGDCLTDGRNGDDDDNDVDDHDDVLSKFNLPRELPNIVEIKKALPSHCFVPNPWTSVYYMVKDFTLVAFLYLVVECSWTALPLAAQLIITPTYWLLQSVLFTAIFVVGHDGGHGSFSQSSLLNDMCGNLCHAFLLCPYFMWKLSHRNHHKNTGNIDKEEVYYPIRERDRSKFFGRMLPGFGLGIGWFTYLFEGYRPRAVYHYTPFQPMFRNHVFDCLISLAFLAGWLVCLKQYWACLGLASLLYHWVVPTLGFGSFIVIITFLHHTDQDVPWYNDRLWNYVRGQLSSVDRHYGWCHGIIHNIGTHQIHHLFPIIPHYHLEEATASFRKAFPHLVRVNNQPILPAFYRMFQKYIGQHVIGDATQIHVYK